MKKKLKLVIKVLIAFMALLAVLMVYLISRSDNSQIDITYYRVVSEKIGNEVRVVQLSDLHNAVFGRNNEKLVKMIQEAKPDLILMTGDMVNDDDTDVSVVLSLCEQLLKTAPVYYSLGNHEGNLIYGKDYENVDLDRQLYAIGVPVLYSDSRIVNVNGNEISLGAVAAAPHEYERLSKPFVEEYVKDEHFKLLMSHYPSLYYRENNCLYDADIDLALAGHYHGGQVRIPFLGGAFHVDTGLFPKYAGGKYRLEKGTLIVSRGLGNHESVGRINNPPELVVIDISHQ